MARGRHAAPVRRMRWFPFGLAAVALLMIGGLTLYTPSYASHHSVAPTTLPPTTTRPAMRLTMPPHACPSGACIAWRSVDRWVPSHPAYIAAFHPAGQPNVIAYAGWFRTTGIDVGLYPGYKGPGPSSLPRGPEAVPLSGRPRLVATFNSGFYEADNAGGFYAHHTTYFPMVRGAATFIRYQSGRLAIEAWPGGSVPATVQMARQNLTLLVSRGHATPRSAINADWGITLYGAPAVWRSAIALDRNGNLMYLAAPSQTSASLTSILLQLHAQSAMELDINPEWPILVTYAAPGAVGPTLDVANPNQIPSRFLYSSTKDFFAVFASRHTGEATPW